MHQLGRYVAAAPITCTASGAVMTHLPEQQLLLLQQQCPWASSPPYIASFHCSSHSGPRYISGVSYSNVGSGPRSSSCSGRTTYPLPPYPLYQASSARLVAETYIGSISGTRGPYHAPFTPQNSTAYRDLSTPSCVISDNSRAVSLRVASGAGLGHNYRYQQQQQQQQQSGRLVSRRRTDTDALIEGTVCHTVTAVTADAISTQGTPPVDTLHAPSPRLIVRRRTDTDVLSDAASAQDISPVGTLRGKHLGRFSSCSGSSPYSNCGSGSGSGSSSSSYRSYLSLYGPSTPHNATATSTIARTHSLPGFRAPSQAGSSIAGSFTGRGAMNPPHSWSCYAALVPHAASGPHLAIQTGLQPAFSAISSNNSSTLRPQSSMASMSHTPTSSYGSCVWSPAGSYYIASTGNRTPSSVTSASTMQQQAPVPLKFSNNASRHSSNSGLPPLGPCAMTSSGSFNSATGFKGLPPNPPQLPVAISGAPGIAYGAGPGSIIRDPSYGRLSVASGHSLATSLRPGSAAAAAAVAAAASEQRQAPPAARQQAGFSSSQPEEPGQHGLPGSATWGTTDDSPEGVLPESPKAATVGCFSWLFSCHPKGSAGTSPAPKAEQYNHPSRTQVLPAKEIKFGRKMNRRWGKMMGRWQQSSSSSSSGRVEVLSPTGSQDSLSVANLGHVGCARQNDTSLALAEFAAEAAAAAAAALRPPSAGHSSWGMAGDAYVSTSSNTGYRVPHNMAGVADASTGSNAGCRVPQNMQRASTGLSGLDAQDQTDPHVRAQMSLALTTVHSGDKAAAAAALAAMAAAAVPRMPKPSALVNPMVGLKPLSRVQLKASALDMTAQRQGLGLSDSASGLCKGHRSASTPGCNSGGLLLAYRGSMAGSTSTQRVRSTVRQHAAVSEAGHGRRVLKQPEGTRLRAATIAGSRVSRSGRSSSSLLSEQMSLVSTPRSVFSTLSSNSSSSIAASNSSRAHSVTDSGVIGSSGQQVASLYRSPSKMQAMTEKGQLSWQPTGQHSSSSNSSYLSVP